MNAPAAAIDAATKFWPEFWNESKVAFSVEASSGNTGHATTAEGKPYLDVFDASRYTKRVLYGPNLANFPPGGVGKGAGRSQLETAHNVPTVAPPDKRATALRAAETEGHPSPSAAVTGCRLAITHARARTMREERRGMVRGVCCGLCEKSDGSRPFGFARLKGNTAGSSE